MKPITMSITKPGICGILAMVILNSCYDKEMRKREYLKVQLQVIEKNIKVIIDRQKKKDFELLYSIIAYDSNYLEVDPDSGLVRGFSEFKRMKFSGEVLISK
jgi:hypothetical protein